MGRSILTQTDLRGFAPTARSLVLDAVDRGWTAYLSNKNHAVLHWPGGGSSAVARNLSGRRRLENARAQLARVERQHPLLDKERQVTTDTDTDTRTTWSPWKRYNGTLSYSVEVSNTGLYRCAICGRQFDTGGGGVARHATRAHGKEAVLMLAASRTLADAAPSESSVSTEAETEAEVELKVEPEPEVEALPVAAQAGDVSGLVELLTGKLVTELALERERSARVRENLAAIRDLIDEVLNDRG